MRGQLSNGETIRQLRKLKGFTQEQLAEAAGCATRTIRNVEQSKLIDIKTLQKIAVVLVVPLATISVFDSVSEEDQQQRHIGILHEWFEAFLESDIPRLLTFHHPETVLELPGAGTMPGIPESAIFTGLEALREHFTIVFSQFCFLRVLQQTFDAKGDLVFHRSTTTLRGIETGKEATVKFYNEFEFRDGLIIRRMTISDLAGHRHILGMD